VTHSASSRFWERYATLPEDIRGLADKCYELLKNDPRHPSLHFKKLGNFWSARVGLHHRALAVEVEGGMLLGVIGTHAEYDRLA
jgi:hypothetical protein